MLKEHVRKLCEKRAVPSPLFDQRGGCFIALDPDLEIHMREFNPGVSFHADVLHLPSSGKEELFAHLLHANVLGQGTNGARFGLSGDAKQVTLTSGFPYEMTYEEFHDALELFINYTAYWREEIKKRWGS